MPSQLTFSYDKTLTLCISARNNVIQVKEQLTRLALLESEVLDRMEIIIMDNDSTDGTSTVVKQFEQSVPFKYISNTEHLSHDNSFMYALNNAISTHSKYLWLLDARNIVKVAHFGQLLDLLEKEAGLGLVFFASKPKASKQQVKYIEPDEFLQYEGIRIIETSRHIIRTDLIRHYNPREFGAGSGIPAVPLYLHVALAAQQNIVFNPSMFESGGIDYIAEVSDPIRTYVKNLLSVFDHYEDKEQGETISPVTTMRMKGKVSDFMLPLIMPLFLLRKSTKGIDGSVSRKIVKENLGARPTLSLLKRCVSGKVWGRIFGAIFRAIRAVFTFIAAMITIMVCNTVVVNAWTRFKNSLNTYKMRYRLKQLGKNALVEGSVYTIGNKSICIGSDFHSRPGMHLECILTDNYSPRIIIGDNVKFEENVRIDAVRDVRIGNNVLVGRNVYIVDYQQGRTNLETLHLAPMERDIYTAGPVDIEDNVVIGPNAVILPGVKIGKGAVVGAGAVVTRNVAPHTVVVGTPAKVKSQTPRPHYFE